MQSDPAGQSSPPDLRPPHKVRPGRSVVRSVPPPPGNNRPLRVLFVSAEVTPFRKTGGLADVAGSLPKALKQRGIDVRVVMPLYQGMNWYELDRLDGLLSVPTYHGRTRAGVRLGKLPDSDVPIYFIEYNRFFDRPHPYGPPGDAYGDNLERFSFFSRAALELTKSLGFEPDVIHANDWQTALVPVYTNTVEWAQALHGAASVFTIHNMAYQGVFGKENFFVTGLGPEHLHADEFEHFGDVNLMKAAIVHSTMLSTVSPTYAQEIQSGPHGCGLDGVIARRKDDLWGILNGIDADEWDPSKDPALAKTFDANSLDGKMACKLALQHQLGLAARPEVPLFALIGRLSYQKGYDVFAHSLNRLLEWDIQVVLLGTGDPEAEHYFRRISSHRGDKFRALVGYDPTTVHRIEAGADFFIMPSRFEPCGLNQMYSQCYGTLPIVRATGGLVDTVESYDEATGSGTGFVFADLTPSSIANTVGWALSTYHDRPQHIRAMRRRAMVQDRSWGRAARIYEQLYHQAYSRRRGHAFPFQYQQPA